MSVLLWVVFGALAGWIASLIMRTDEEQGALGNIVIGIIGALIGGFISRLFGGEGITGFNVTSMVLAILGASLLLFVFRRATHHSV